MKQGGPPQSQLAAERRERLRRQTGEAAHRMSQHRAEPVHDPQPGDVLLSPWGDAALWWLVLETRDGILTLMPADDREWAGLNDLPVPKDLFPSPLTLRCGFVTEVAADAFVLAKAAHVGHLPEALLRQTRELREACESGTLEPSPWQDEHDHDVLYLEWQQEVLRPASKALAASSKSEGKASAAEGAQSRPSAEVVELAQRRRSRSAVWMQALAAVLAVALVGVGWLWVGAERELGAVWLLEDRSVPLNLTRALDGVPIEVRSAEGKRAFLHLEPSEAMYDYPQKTRIELRSASGKVLKGVDGENLGPTGVQFLIPVPVLRKGVELWVQAPDEHGEPKVTRNPIRLIETPSPGASNQM